MLSHHPRPQRSGRLLLWLEQITEVRSGYLVVQAVIPETCFSLAKPVVRKLFELTQSAVVWKRNTLPDTGEIGIHDFQIRYGGVKGSRKGSQRPLQQAGVEMQRTNGINSAGRGKHRHDGDTQTHTQALTYPSTVSSDSNTAITDCHLLSNYYILTRS